MLTTIRNRCLECPRKTKDIDGGVKLLCDLHWETHNACKTCLLKNCAGDCYSMGKFCVRAHCWKRAMYPTNKPIFCFDHLTEKSNDGSFKRCSNRLIKKRVDRCSFCFQFTIHRRILLNDHAEFNKLIYVCCSCAAQFLRQTLMLLPSAVATLCFQYLWFPLEVGKQIQVFDRTRVLQVCYTILKVDMENGLYIVQKSETHPKSPIPTVFTIEMARIKNLWSLYLACP